MVLHESKFSRLDFYPADSLIELTWLPGTSNMSEEDYKAEALIYLNNVLAMKPVRNITNMQQMHFVFIPEIQIWTNEVIFIPILKVGLNKVAIVVSNDLYLAVSTEQTMEEAQGMKFMTKYFNDRESANAWILESE